MIGKTAIDVLVNIPNKPNAVPITFYDTTYYTDGINMQQYIE